MTDAITVESAVVLMCVIMCAVIDLGVQHGSCWTLQLLMLIATLGAQIDDIILYVSLSIANSVFLFKDLWIENIPDVVEWFTALLSSR